MARHRDANELLTIFCYTMAASTFRLADSARGRPIPEDHGGYQILTCAIHRGRSVQRFRALESATAMSDMWPMT
jgi:hypothetical protein